MKKIQARQVLMVIAGIVALAAFVSASQDQTPNQNDSATARKAIQQRLSEIQRAAEALDAEKVFSFVLENNSGALAQNGNLLLTRGEALESAKQGFENLARVHYQMGQEHITMLSPTIALVVAQGSSSASTKDGRDFSSPFVQSVVLILTNGDWKVLHAHRSFPGPR